MQSQNLSKTDCPNTKKNRFNINKNLLKVVSPENLCYKQHVKLSLQIA